MQGGLFNFHPAVRPVQLEVHIDGFPGKHYCPRMATMNKPAYTAIRTHSPDKPVLIFVSSRRQTRLTAFDLVAFVAAEDNPKQWLHMPDKEVIYTLRQCELCHGVVMVICHFVAGQSVGGSTGPESQV